MKTITITQKLAEEIVDQLEGAQKDCYVQSTENVINDLKQALRIYDVVGRSEQLNTDLDNEVFNNDKDWTTNEDVDEHFRSV